MPRDSGGDYILPAGYLAVTGQTILISSHNPPLEDIQTALTNSLDRSGKGSMLANLNFGSFKGTNLADGTNPQDAATVRQLSSASPVGILADYAGDIAPAGWLLCYGQAVSRSEYPDLFSVLGIKYGSGDGTTTFNVPDCRDRARIGKGNMGGSAAGRITSAVSGINTSILGAAGGSQSHILTVAQLPAHGHSFSGTTGNGGIHSHSFSGTGTTQPGGSHYHDIPAVNRTASGIYLYGASSGGVAGVGTSVAPNHQHDFAYSGTTDNSSAHNHSFSGTTGNAGSGQAHPNVQPVIVFNTIIKAV